MKLEMISSSNRISTLKLVQISEPGENLLKFPGKSCKYAVIPLKTPEKSHIEDLPPYATIAILILFNVFYGSIVIKWVVNYLWIAWTS